MKTETERLALLSVSDKSGIVEFAKVLKRHGIDIISSGGTARKLRENGVEAMDVSEYTGFPECFEGRVKTMHPLVEGGILFRRDHEGDLKDLEMLEEKGYHVKPIDFVVCNLYPFEEAVAQGATLDEKIEKIDIGGPTMLISAVKNYKHVAAIADPTAYEAVAQELENNDGKLSLVTKALLAVYAVNRIADYRAANAVELTRDIAGENTLRLKFEQGKKLGRYAENWHQKGWLFVNSASTGPNVVKATQIAGPAMGFNNYVDADAALALAMEFKDSEEAFVSVIKHTNPCGSAAVSEEQTGGAASGESLLEAITNAWNGDPISAFGSIVATNRAFGIKELEYFKDKFVEIIIAPEFTQEAKDFLANMSETDKKAYGRIRFLETGNLTQEEQSTEEYRLIEGGLLVQERNNKFYLGSSITDILRNAHTEYCPNSGKKLTVGVVTGDEDKALEKASLIEFGLKHVKHVKSNAVCIYREYEPGKYQVLGMGAGQPNRMVSSELAANKARENLRREYLALNPDATEDEIKKYQAEQLAQCIAVSDAMFPFADGLEKVAESGVKIIVNPGGSVRDNEVHKAAEKYGITLIQTGVREFKH